MPRMPAKNTAMDGKRKRQPVGSVRQRSRTASVRKVSKGSDDATRPIRASAAGPGQPGAGPEASAQVGRPADLGAAILSPSTLAAAASLDSSAALAANGGAAAPGGAHPGNPESATPAPAAEEPSLQDCIASARLHVRQLARLLAGRLRDRAPNSAEVLDNAEWQEDAAQVIGECMHFYGISAADVVSHPLAKLAMAVVLPLGLAAYADWQLHKQAAKAATAAAPPPPPSVPAASFGAERMPPPSTLATQA